MIALPAHSTVLIVGAGPSGLMMAAQLLRYGLQPVIVDQKTALTRQSRALLVHARSLEIFRQLGIDSEAVTKGNFIGGLSVYNESEQVAQLDLGAAAKDSTLYPGVLVLEQSKTEQILLDFLTANACPVFWNTELLGIQPSDSGVTLTLREENTETTVSCDWLIGADGASGLVRSSLGISFTGGTYSNRFYLADLKLDPPVDQNHINIFLKDEGLTAIFPMSGDNCRFIGVLPKTLKDRTGLTFDDVRPYITYTLGFPLGEAECNWFSSYQLHHRMAERFGSRRCFLIGDAAHIHSPVGGQGMNTGLQDACNLAWKLGGVINRQYNERILLTYSFERMPVARKLLKTTDRLFALAATRNRLLKKLRNWLLPLFLKRLWMGRDIPANLFRQLSQTGIHYRDSPLSVHHGSSRRVSAGDRLPFLQFYDEKLKQPADLHLWCSKPGFTLLVLGVLSARNLHLLARWIKATYPSQLHFYYLPWSERNRHVFNCFEMGENQKKAVVVRPDLHIGYMNDIVDIDLIDNYLKGSIGWKGYSN